MQGLPLMVRRSIFFLGAIAAESRESKERLKFAEIIEQKIVWMQESCFKSIRNKEIPSPPLFIISPKMIVEGSLLREDAKRVELPDV